MSFSCDKNNLTQIRQFVTDSLEPYALSEIDLNHMVLAVDEICANLIIHANSEDKSKFLHLKVFPKKDEVIFEIKDSGKAFDMSKYKEPNIEELIRIGKKGGVGMALVYRTMDKVEFSSANGKNVCRLYKKIPVPKAR